MKSLIPKKVINMKEYGGWYTRAVIPVIVVIAVLGASPVTERFYTPLMVLGFTWAALYSMVRSHRIQNPHATLIDSLELIAVGRLYQAEDEREEFAKQSAGYKTFLLVVFLVTMLSAIRMSWRMSEVPDSDLAVSFWTYMGSMWRHAVDAWVGAGFLGSIGSIALFRMFLRQERIAFTK